MADNFFDLGKEGAIGRLFDGCSLKKGGNGSSASVLLMEGTDFDLTYFPLKHLGYKAVVMVTAELLSRLAAPEGLSLRLGVSSKLDFPQIQELWTGVTTAAVELGYKTADLDLKPSRNGLIISVSATGTINSGTLENRPEAKSKDVIAVSGPLGAAFLGQQVLERENRKFSEKTDGVDQKTLDKYKMIIGDYLKPEIEASVASRLEETGIVPSFGYAVSNGLSDAVKRLVRDSGLGAKIYVDKIPFEGNSFDAGKFLDIDPVSAAMNGGEDCRLLYVIPILQAEKFRREFPSFDIIGHLALPDVGAVLVTPDGIELPMRAQGW